jgi:membrane protease YdiL (CAAX protease family)
MTAMILAALFLGQNMVTFTLAGGLSGLAAKFTPPTIQDELIQMAIFVLFGALGVGLGTRRNLRELAQRLGLRAPTFYELTVAVGFVFLFFIAAFFIADIWQRVTPPDVFDQQNQLSSALDQSIGTLSFGFALAMTAAIGEEILYRGALQPIFGLWPTAIYFALSHIQYTLTPAALIIVVVGLGLGWLRRQYNTTTSMTAHFLYDYLSTALSLLARLPIK